MKVCAIVVGLVVTLVVSNARAQGDDIAAAEALFQEGRQLMDAGSFADACPKLEESQRLDPGTGTLWHLARCYEKIDRHASAWAKYHEVAAQAKRQGEPAKIAAALKRARALEPKLRRLVISVPADSRVTGLRITRNGAEVGPGAWGAKLPVDRGQHEIVATAAGHQSWTKNIVIGEQPTTSVEVPKLAAQEKRDPDPWKGVEPPPTVEVKPWYADRFGWVLVAGGLVITAGGTAALLHGNSLETNAKNEPDLGERDRLFDSADRYRLAGGLLFGAAAGAVLAGVIKLAITEQPSQRQVRASLRTTDSGIMVGIGTTF